MSDWLTVLNRPALPIVQATLAFGSVGTTYTQVSGFTGPALIVIIYSSFNKDVQFSWDGINDFMAIPSGQQMIFELKTNHIVLPEQYAAFVKQISAAPTSGTFYISGFNQI